MSHRTSAQIICDSLTPYGAETRLTSILVVFPKMILGERNRHRAFSLSDRSSRAVPPEKLLSEVRADPAMPARFRARVPGMSGGAALEGEDFYVAEARWKYAALAAADAAQALNDCGLAKEIVNRPLDPFIRMKSLMTATRDGWMNFFGLRLDAAADPTIQVLARKCFAAYKDSTPRALRADEWHLPFIDAEEADTLSTSARLKLSAARCAHLSYEDLQTGERLGEAAAERIYDKLVNSLPLHASPTEHQAQVGAGAYYLSRGNFTHGWIQARKLIPGEAIAPLP
jgi:thymidylate synthase ThyX